MMLKVKVCGMRDPGNIREVGDLSPDYMGFIFSPESKRYVGSHPDLTIFKSVSSAIRRVGVFVNEDPGKVEDIVGRFHLDMVQLHGLESAAYCRHLQQKKIQVIKAFPMGKDFDFNQLNDYERVVDYFLFDGKGKNPGGNGLKFDWLVLGDYSLSVPFFLSGGIGPDDASAIKRLNHSRLYALDLNSGFECAPAQKDPVKLKKFLTDLRHR